MTLCGPSARTRLVNVLIVLEVESLAVFARAFQEGSGQWLSLDAELLMRDGEVVGTKHPTGHSLLVDCRFELPFGKYLLTFFFLA